MLMQRKLLLNTKGTSLKVEKNLKTCRTWPTGYIQSLKGIFGARVSIIFLSYCLSWMSLNRYTSNVLHTPREKNPFISNGSPEWSKTLI